MVTFFKSQKELAQALIEVIDAYWAKSLMEEDMMNKIDELVQKNREKIFTNGDYASVIKQRLGKKRLALVIKVMELKGEKTV